MARNPRRPRRALLAGAFDLVAVILFVVVGRAVHHEPGDFVDFLVTLWPFVTGLVIGWLAAQAWRRPFRLPLPGIPIWVITVVGGMMFRVASSQGVAWAFVGVAAGTLGVLFLGWRAIALVSVRGAVPAAGRS
ncbi:MAG TPA: DUF3054 domain-containing protein [Microbacteriaceae bacterium]|nr:DUF3054 domain-containing protein [Microbacteriaceae bacterium]